MLEIRKEINAIAKHLYANGYEGTIHFDHKTYDDSLDIPSLDIDGERVWVSSFYVNETGNILVITDSDNNAYSTNFDEIPEEWNDDYFVEIGLDTLLRDVYYETTESYEIGDYELDFLPKFINN